MERDGTMRALVTIVAIGSVVLVANVVASSLDGFGHAAFVVVGGLALLTAPAVAGGAMRRRAVPERVLVPLSVAAIDIAILNVFWTGGKDNDTVRSHVEATAIMLLLSLLLAVVVFAARPFPAAEEVGR
jgi:hypothetical protein